MNKRVTRFIAAFLAASMGSGSMAVLPGCGLLTRPPTLTAKAEDLIYGDLTYIYNSDGVTVTGYTGTGTSVDIPGIIDGMFVTAIFQRAFYGNRTLTSVSIPESVTEIGAEAFSGCTSLTGVVFHEGLESIGRSAFRNTALTEVTIPVSVTVCTGAFADCAKLKKAVFADGTVNIPDSCLYYTKGLTEVSIPDTVRTIGKDAFNSCTSLEEITLPAGLESIGVEAFRATALTEITLPASLKECSGGFSGCSSLRKAVFADGTETVPSGCLQNARSLEDVTLPDSVTAIGSDAFMYCTALTGITLHEGIESVGSRAFGNSGITEITIPVSLTSCTEGFKDCRALRKVTFSDGTVEIPGGCLSGASGLEEVCMPDTVTTINREAFSGCSDLEEIDLHEGITAILNDAFYSSGLTEVTLPASLTKCEAAFKNCERLKKVTFADGTVTIPARCISGSAAVTEVIIPDSVRTIGGSAFAGTSALKSISLPGQLTAIGSSAFENSGLRSITVPDSVTKADSSAFSSCGLMKTAVIGSGLSTLSSSLFSGCRSLVKVTLPETVTVISANTFSGCSSLSETEYPGTADSISAQSNSFRGCYSLRDPRFVHLSARGTGLKADRDAAAVGDTVNFTVSFDDSEGFGDRNEDRTVTINLPEGFTADIDSVEVLSGIAAGKAVSGIGTLSIPFVTDSGTVIFSASVDAAGDQTVTADLKMVHDGISGYAEPIGMADVSAAELSISASPSADGSSAVIKGSGPAGCTVEVYMNDELIAPVSTNPHTGSFSMTAALPAGISDGDEISFHAESGGAVSDKAVITYSADAPVISSIKLCTDKAAGDTDVTGAFTGSLAPVFLLPDDGTMKFTLEISNSELVSKVYVTGEVNGILRRLEAVYNDADGVWTAEGSFPGSSGTVPEDINFVIITQEDAEAGIVSDFTKSFFPAPGGIEFRLSPSGTVSDKDTEEPVSGAELTLIGLDSSGEEYVCDLSGYDQLPQTFTGTDGGYAWRIPDGEWKIACSADGYDAAESEWFSIPGDSPCYDFSLSRNEDISADPAAVPGESPQTTAPAGTEPYVPNEASEIIPDGHFREGVNNWGFNNIARNFRYQDEDIYYMTEEDYNRLVSGLSHAEVYCIENKMLGKWNGSCYGMANLALLSCYGIFDPMQRDPAATTVNSASVPPTPDMISAINYYHMLQMTDSFSARSTASLYDIPEDVKTQFVLDEIAQGHPVLIPFNYSYADSDGSTKTSGHVALGYAAEEGSFEFDGRTFDRKVLTYDPNILGFRDEVCMFISTADGSWMIPRYQNRGADSKMGGRLGCCSSDPYFLNEHGLFNRSAAPESAEMLPFLSTLSVSADYTLRKVELGEDGTYFTCPADEQDIEVYAGMDGSEDGSGQELNFILDDTSKAYSLDLDENDSVDLMLRTENELIRLRFNDADEIIVDPAGMVRASGGISDFIVTMVSNDGFSPTDWHNVEVSGAGAQIEFRRTDSGYVLSGDDLTDIKVSAEGSSTGQACTFSTELDEVFIHEIAEDVIGIAVDADTDGIFEQELETVPAERPVSEISRIIAGHKAAYIPSVPALPVTVGDTNGDSITDANDASEILSLYAQLSTGNGTVSEEAKTAGDVNGDGLLDSADASLILEYYALASTSADITAEAFFRERRTS